MRRKITSNKHNYKNQTLRARDFPYLIERTVSGTLYARTQTGQLINIEKAAQRQKNK